MTTRLDKHLCYAIIVDEMLWTYKIIWDYMDEMPSEMFFGNLIFPSGKSAEVHVFMATGDPEGYLSQWKQHPGNEFVKRRQEPGTCQILQIKKFRWVCEQSEVTE